MKQGWEIKKLGEVCEIINGFAFKSNLFTDEGEDILRISNIQNGYVDLTDIAHFSKDDYPKTNFEKYAVFPNDIVVALSGATTGKFGINKTEKKLYLNQRVAICRESSSELNHLFLLYYLKTQSKSFLESAEGVAQPNLSTEQMKQYDIPIPLREEQERIVEELDCLSGVIERKREQLKELDALAQSIFYQMFGDPITNEKGWETRPLKNSVIEMFLGPFGSALKTDCYVGKEDAYCMVYEQKHAIKKTMELETHYIDKEKFESLKRFEVHSGDFIMSCRGTIGEIYRLPNDAPIGIIHPSLMKIRIKEDVYHPTFFIRLLTHIVKNENTNGNCVQMAITAKELGAREPIVPPLALQQEFADKIEAIEKQKELIKKSITQTEELFNSRMDYYFN